ncbi:hypothetical protein [Yersinia ruckeri]|uniref:hypothetical protein n=1 Tax=Yersinia ruckeri TaxID=29486 RepID=UPI0020BF550E|nr:hypothetical protein [Yersinia ruckeri]MCK8571306.1 hypothetical protein [Yersinia ruckeri]MCK8577691.1 hypothetical protein [Yersinia ruckeri]MCK8581434.1 hypothetical protein [Yersinia ruckeri]MCW6540505.1 hypothetical protein [Yersinia ruckeri]UZX52879.1 hypothetical protein ND441_04875 [Yersinia ruckeri]
MSENTDYDKACREIARIAAALGIVDYSGDTSEIFDAIIIKDENHQALAGENAVMLKLLTDISENHSEFVDEGEDCMCASIPLDYVSEINMHVSRDVNAENPFIATDKALNEISRIPDDEDFFAHEFECCYEAKCPYCSAEIETDNRHDANGELLKCNECGHSFKLTANYEVTWTTERHDG